MPWLPLVVELSTVFPQAVGSSQAGDKAYGLQLFMLALNCLSCFSKADRTGDISDAISPLLLRVAVFAASRIQVFFHCDQKLGQALRLSREKTGHGDILLYLGIANGARQYAQLASPVAKQCRTMDD